MSKYTNVVTTIGFGKATANTGSDLMSMKKGDVLIVDARTGNIITAITALTAKNYPAVQVATCVRDGQPILSAEMHGGGLLEATSLVPSRERVLGSMEVGFNGSTGVSIPTYSEDTTFVMSTVVHLSQQLNQQRTLRSDVTHVGLGGVDCAIDILAQMCDNSDNNPGQPGYFPVVGAVTASATRAPIASLAVTLQNGSNKMVMVGAGSPAVGDYVQIGSTVEAGAGADIAGNGGIFKVMSIEGSVAILSHKNNGVSVSASALNKVTAILKVGLSLFPRKANEQTNPVEPYGQLGKFDVGVNEAFADCVVVDGNTPDDGEGYGWQVQGTEIKCMGYLGFTDRLNPMRQGYQFQADISAQYNQIAITCVKGWNQSEIGSSNGTSGVMVAFPSSGDTQKDAVTNILKPWLEYFGVPATNLPAW